MITIGQMTIHNANPTKNVAGGMVKTKTSPKVHIRQTIIIGIHRITISNPMFLGITFVGLKSVQ